MKSLKVSDLLKTFADRLKAFITDPFLQASGEAHVELPSSEEIGHALVVISAASAVISCLSLAMAGVPLASSAYLAAILISAFVVPSLTVLGVTVLYAGVHLMGSRKSFEECVGCLLLDLPVTLTLGAFSALISGLYETTWHGVAPFIAGAIYAIALYRTFVLVGTPVKSARISCGVLASLIVISAFCPTYRPHSPLSVKYSTPEVMFDVTE